MEHSQEDQKLLVRWNDVGEVEEGHPLKGGTGSRWTIRNQLRPTKTKFSHRSQENELTPRIRKEATWTHADTHWAPGGLQWLGGRLLQSTPRGMQVQMAATHQWQWLLTGNDLTKFVHVPLSTGDLNCQSYLSHTHGGFICLVLCGLYPVVLVVLVNGDLGARNESGLLSGEANIFSCHIRASNPVSRKISFPISFQTVLAVLLGPNNINYL